MAKAKRERTLKDNEAQAVLRMVRISPQKLNLVAALIRGKKASAALAELSSRASGLPARCVKPCRAPLRMRRTITIWMSTA
jgi:large subunit ribosomal protein L22